MTRKNSFLRRLTLITVAQTLLLASTFGSGIPLFTVEAAQAVTGCSTGSVSTDSSASPVIVVTFSAGASASGSCTWTVPDNVYSADYLVVAGGGGGGSGGGGGGGVVTSFASTTNPAGTSNAASSPLAVNPGDDIAITVGIGGSGGAGGSSRYNGTAGSAHLTRPGNGSNSSLGSISATGGGAGGHRQSDLTVADGGIGQTGGSSGGDSYDRSSTGGAVAASSSVVGAQSFGNDGGGSPGGSYSSGGGGGGAGSAGGNARQLSAGCGAENCTSNYHGGGHGGRGITSSISGTAVEYGCGGGGGVNSNNNVVVTGASGNAGCSGAGKGSAYGNLYTNYTVTSTTTNANATAGTAGRGGGGGGTDPEDSRGGSGGSGVVIVRYTLQNAACPYSSSTSVTNPVACSSTLTVTAGASAVDKVMRGSPVSYASSSATLTVLTTPTASSSAGNMSVSVVSGGSLRISVPSGSSLIGGTYPVTYRLTENGNTSDSYLLVTVEDPNVRAPAKLLVHPKLNSLTLPVILTGDSNNVLVCVIQRSDSHGDVTIAASSSSGVTIQNRTRGVSLAGSASDVSSALGAISVTANASDGSIVPSGDTRTLTINVSNTSNGGNNACSGGTSKTLELQILPIDLTYTTTVSLAP